MLPGKAYKPEDILQILRWRIWFLLVPFAVVSAVVAAVVHELPDRYRSETVILVVPCLQVADPDAVPGVSQAVASSNTTAETASRFGRDVRERFNPRRA